MSGFYIITFTGNYAVVFFLKKDEPYNAVCCLQKSSKQEGYCIWIFKAQNSDFKKHIYFSHGYLRRKITRSCPMLPPSFHTEIVKTDRFTIYPVIHHLQRFDCFSLFSLFAMLKNPHCLIIFLNCI